MLVEKAAVYEDRFAKPRKDDVWSAGQIAAVQAEPVAECVRRTSYTHLRQRVDAADAPHVLAAALRRQLVYHETLRS